MRMMIKTIQLIAFIATCLLADSALAKPKVATVSPITYSLTSALTEQTDIQVSYLPPTRLPINRIASWIRKNSSKKFEIFDALVGIRSVKPELDLYPSLRQSNIRLVYIDIAQAVKPSGERVAIVTPAEYFWLNSNNLLLMLGILKRDLTSLWPQYSEIFAHNYQTISATIRQVNIDLDESLIAAEIAFIVPDKTKLSPFVSSLSCDVSDQQQAEQLGLRYLKLTASNKAKGKIWQIDDFSRYSTAPLAQRLNFQVSALTSLTKTAY